MKTKIEQVWDEIAEAAQIRPISDGSFVLRRIYPEFRFDVFAGIDSAGYVMLAVGVGHAPPAMRLESASLDYFRQQRTDGSWLMALRLRQLALSVVFGRLCQDLVDATVAVADEAALVHLFRDRLNLWKKLLENGSGGQLEPYQIKGLVAEILVLESVLQSGNRTPLELVTAWVGPTGADQDFQFSNEAIEVKAISPGSESVSISSLQQLDSALPTRLCVHTLRPASQGEEGAIGLNSLVPRVEGRLFVSPDALALFKGRLLEAGYVEGPYYDTVLFQPISTEEFSVTDVFPRLTPKQVPRGVMSASYLLSLHSIRNPD